MILPSVEMSHERKNHMLAGGYMEEDLICNRVTVDFSLAVTNDILFLLLQPITLTTSPISSFI
jgi:hypothetical protein